MAQIFDWTRERVALLTELWREGLTASQIATRMGAPSRSSVIGKIHRLELNRKFPRRGGGCTKRVSKKTRKPAAFREIKFKTFPLPKPKTEDVARVSFAELEDHHCQYMPPNVDPKPWDKNRKLYCGQDRVPGLKWCLAHAHTVYQPPETRKTKKPIKEGAFA